jgi:hypothetical protein
MPGDSRQQLHALAGVLVNRKPREWPHKIGQANKNHEGRKGHTKEERDD